MKILVYFLAATACFSCFESANAEISLSLTCRIAKVTGGTSDIMVYVDEIASRINEEKALITDDELSWSEETDERNTLRFSVNRHTGSMRWTWVRDSNVIQTYPGTCTKTAGRKF